MHTASSLSIQCGHRKTFQATWSGVDGFAHCPKSQLRGTRACRGAPGTDASLWTQWTTCAPRCGQQKNGKAGRLSPQRVGARGRPSAQPGDPAQRREPLPLPLPGPARPRRPPESREALEDTRRIHLLKRLHSFTSVLRQRLPDPGLGPECPPPGCGGSTLQLTSLLRRWAEPCSSLSNKRSS